MIESATAIPVSQPSIGASERRAVNDVMESGWLTQGEMVEQFEGALARRLGVAHARACTSGTTALHLALTAVGVGPGDEVIVPDLTFVATANAVAYTGAKVVLVDVDPRTWTIDPVEVERAITSATRAIVPVHLYGVACDMEALCKLTSNGRIRIVEDAAEALGTYWHGRPAGALGDISAFSFYGNKVITTGEGGAVVTGNTALAVRVALLRGQGVDQHRRYYHSELGFNYRMTEMQAAIGVAQMARLDEMLIQRERIFSAYKSMLYPQCVAPKIPEFTVQAPWVYTFTLPYGFERDGLMEFLHHHNVDTRPTFVPLHRLPMYEDDETRFPNASSIGDRGVSLPTFSDMELVDVSYVAHLVNDWISISTGEK